MSLKKKFTFITICILTMVSVPVLAQDILAKQAPVDRRMRAVDTLALKNIIAREEIEAPSASLYDTWDNAITHRQTELPDSFRIDLRHFHMPTTSRVITSKMGPRWGRVHKGLDIKVYIGDTIRAAFSGKVRVKKYEAAGYGKYLVLRHPNGLETIYGHMSAWLVDENQTVKAGQPIGLGGNTGRSTGSHLHFETRLCGVALNPALMFDFVNQDVTGDYYTFVKSRYERENSSINNTFNTRPGGSGLDLAAAPKDAKKTTRRTEDEETEAVAEAPVIKTTSQAGGDMVRYHKVVVGETLSSIAKRRGLTVKELCKLNNLSTDVKVRPGQLLRYT